VSTERFTYQRDLASRALAQPRAIVLNVGCNDDPAAIKRLDPGRVINCDLVDHDQVLDRPNVVDQVFDAARDRWPFDGESVELVILGDILEHLTPDEIQACLIEARRVSQRLCITVPLDDRETTSDERADEYPRGAVHRTIVTSGLLEQLLEGTGWMVTDWRSLGRGVWWTNYFFVEAI
jgi:hypothetical protein